MYSFMWVIMIFALIYAFHFATKYHLIELTKYADPNTLAENARMHQRTYVLYPKPKELDLPHADNYTSTKYWDDHTKTRKKKEAARGEAELGSVDDAEVDLADYSSAGPSASEIPQNKQLADLGQLRNLFPIVDAGTAHAGDAKIPKERSGGGRGKSPGPQKDVPMCTNCNNVKLTGEKFKQSGICATCTKKKK